MNGITPQDWELISSYADGQLTNEEKTRLEKRLATNPALRSALKELRHTQFLMRSVPRLRPPRNFTLTSDMVRSGGFNFPRLFPAFSFASAISFILLVATFIIQGLLPASVLPAASAPQEMAQEMDRGQPDIIYWGSPPAVSPADGKGGGGGQVPQNTYLQTPDVSMQMVPEPKTGEGERSIPQNPESPASSDIVAVTPTPEAPVMMVQPETSVGEPPPAVSPAQESLTSPTPEGIPQELTPIPPAENNIPVSTLEGTGPILGLPEMEEKGKMTVPESSSGVPSGETTPFEPDWFALRIVLASLAILSAIIASILWWKNRHVSR